MFICIQNKSNNKNNILKHCHINNKELQGILNNMCLNELINNISKNSKQKILCVLCK